MKTRVSPFAASGEPLSRVARRIKSNGKAIAVGSRRRISDTEFRSGFPFIELTFIVFITVTMRLSRLRLGFSL
jgi:hypothetical protein